jgi:hypothetical protein
MTRHSQSGGPNFVGEPVAYYLTLAGAAMFVLMLAFVASFVIVPIAALAAGGYFLYRRYQLKKLRDAVYTPATAAPPAEPIDEYLTPEDLADRIHVTLLNDAETPTGLFSPKALSNAFTVTVCDLYELEGFHKAPDPPASSERLEVARYLDRLEAWRAKIADPTNLDTFIQTIIDAYMTLREHFPSFALQKSPEPVTSPITVPLQIDATEELIEPFFSQDVHQRRLFEQLREQLSANVATIKTSKLKEPHFRDYFANTPFTNFDGRPVPLTLPDETRFAGSWVIAPQGMGKTTLLHDLIIEDIPKDASIILMDSKGDLIQPFLNMKALDHRRVVIGPDNPIGMNPLDIPITDINKAVDNLEYLFSSLLDFKLTAAQSMLLKAVLRSLITVFPKPNLGTFQDIMSDGPGKYAEYIKRLEPDLQNFFKNEFFSENIKARRQEVLQRLRLLLDHDLLRSMLLAASTTFHVGEAMDRGAFIIINNSRGKLGNKGAEFFGRFFIAQVLAAAQQRSFRKEGDKKPVYFFIDECHTVIAQDERVTDILHECRSQKIALILAHQETTQVSEKVLNALQNCAIRFAHPDEEARKLSPSLRLDPKTLQTMRRGQFAVYARGLSHDGFVANVAKPDFSSVKVPERTPDQKPIMQASPLKTDGEATVDLNSHAPKTETPQLEPSNANGAAKPKQEQAAMPADTQSSELSVRKPADNPDPGEPADTW